MHEEVYRGIIQLAKSSGCLSAGGWKVIYGAQNGLNIILPLKILKITKWQENDALLARRTRAQSLVFTAAG